MKKNQQGKNSNLHQAKREKNDEFYTQLSDIENELKHYREHFQGKIIFCNCDDPYESNFFKYFALNFNRFWLKKLIGMGYAISLIVGMEVPLFEIAWYEEPQNKAYKIEVNQVKDSEDWVFDLEDIKLLIKQNREFIKVFPLKGNGDFSAGDFRSRASIRILQEADIVVTNPPFSLFREYVGQLVEHAKKFLIIGNQNAITYKEIFPLIKDNRLWLGCCNWSQSFRVPWSFSKNNVVVNEQGERIAKFWNIARYTNLEHKKRHEELILYKNYSPEEYPKYDNYDAIEVGKVAEIPEDHEGVMGVPITFLDKYNPDQFEIIWATESEGRGFSNGLWHEESKVAQALIWGQRVYKRLFIRRKK